MELPADSLLATNTQFICQKLQVKKNALFWREVSGGEEKGKENLGISQLIKIWSMWWAPPIWKAQCNRSEEALRVGHPI